MAGPDRSWTIAPALLWFGAALVAGLIAFDGDVDALAHRLTQRREAPPAGAGPAFAPASMTVAEADLPDPGGPGGPGEPGNPAGGAAGAGPGSGAGAGAGSGAASGAPDRARVGALHDVCLEGTSAACKRWGMDAFFRAMAQARRGTLGRALRVSWYGDSVIASDTMTSRLRGKLQRELGDGGPGFVFVVPPHRFCLHEDVARVGGDGDWTSYAVSTTSHPDGLYGVGGAAAETYGASTTLKVVGGKASLVELYYLSQKGGGTVTVSADGAEIIRAETRAEGKSPGFAAATVAGGATRFRVQAEKGRSRVFGLTLENATGAVVDNLGIVSANVLNFAHRDPAHFAAELGHRGADLVMIMLGANEATWLSPRDHETRQYQRRYEKVLGLLRDGRPGASCLVVSPTDQGEATDDGYRSRPVMPVLVEAQRQAALAKGCAFYATYDWMGGKGSAVKWNRSGLLGGDFTHLSVKGANKVADAVFEALTSGFQRYGAP